MQRITFSISQLIGEARLKEACDVMNDFLKGFENQLDIVQQLSLLTFRLSHLQQKVLIEQGGHEKSEDGIERNRIAYDLLELNKSIQKLEKDQTQKEITDPEITNLIYANFYATSEKDLEGVIRTLHPDNPQLEAARALNQMLFEQDGLDLVCEIIPPIRVLSYSDDLALAEVVQNTRNKKPNVMFRPNQTTQICLFKKYKDRWKFYSGAIKKIEYFDLEFTPPS